MQDEPKEDRQELVAKALAEAEALCAEKKVRLTRLRRLVLTTLLSSDCPTKAYDLLEQLSGEGLRLTPASVYRSLDFLIELGLVHKISSLNAYVPCTCHHKNIASLIFICSDCQQVKEINDPELYASMRSRFNELGLDLDDNSIEMRGKCKRCANGVHK
ncbi:MAG: transcriptional repressor [Desulfovibrionaceae bacterium]|nr:transcriptional repressor [Desulfovibrionaceae bacterium]